MEVKLQIAAHQEALIRAQTALFRSAQLVRKVDEVQAYRWRPPGPLRVGPSRRLYNHRTGHRTARFASLARTPVGVATL